MKFTPNYLTIILIFVFNSLGYTYAQSLNWVKQFGGTSEEQGKSIAVDANGNVYTMGYFYGTVDFDPGNGTYNLISAGINDIFISKLDASGNFVWAKRFGGTGSDSGVSIALDASGNVYSTGSYTGTVDFDPGTSTYNLITPTGAVDYFISKLDASGNFVWAKQLAGVSTCNNLFVETNGYVYTTGSFSGTVDFDLGNGTYNLTSNGMTDIFISKLDALGNFIWTKQIGGTTNDQGNSVTTDLNGNVYTIGTFKNTVDFNPGTGNFLLFSSSGTDDVFISKLDNNGNFIWAKQLAASGIEHGNSIKVDVSGNVYSIGDFTGGTVDFNPGTGIYNLSSSNTAIFIWKLDSNGNFVWAKTLAGTGNQVGFSLVLDSYSNVYTTGYFYNTADFDPGTGTYNLTSSPSNNTDIFISKLDASGNFVWAKQLGGLQDQASYSIAVDANSNVYTTGFFYGPADFDPGSGVFNLNSINPDVFIHKMSQCSNVSGTDIRSACGSFTWIDGNTYTTSNNSATYTILNGANNGCDSIVTLNLIINSVSDISTTTNGTTIIANNSNANYQWLDCNNNYSPILGENNQLFTATGNGNYAVQLTEGSCVDTSNCINIILSGTEYHDQNSFKLYPNPNIGEFSIVLDSEYEFIVSTITDTKGILLFTQNDNNTNKIVFDTDFAAGVYFVKVKTNSKNEIFQITIME
jgi:hypothetical protein